MLRKYNIQDFDTIWKNLTMVYPATCKIKGTVAVTFGDFFQFFCCVYLLQFLFQLPKACWNASAQLVNTVCMCATCIVIVDIWILVRTKIHLSTIALFVIHIQAVLISWTMAFQHILGSWTRNCGKYKEQKLRKIHQQLQLLFL